MMTGLETLKKRSLSALDHWQLIRIATIAQSPSHAKRLAKKCNWDEEESLSVAALAQIYFEYGQSAFSKTVYGAWGKYRKLLCLNECHRWRRSFKHCDAFVDECFCSCHICEYEDVQASAPCDGFGKAEVAELEFEPCSGYDSSWCDDCEYRHSEDIDLDYTHPARSAEYMSEIFGVEEEDEDEDDDGEYSDAENETYELQSSSPAILSEGATQSALERVRNIAQPIFDVSGEELEIEVPKDLSGLSVQAHADYEAGTIRITEGLVDLLDDDELAWVIAHEVAHINHGDRIRLKEFADEYSDLARKEWEASVDARRERGDGFLYRVLAGATSLVGYGAAIHTVVRHAGREHEIEADEKALEWVKLAGYDPTAAIEALRALHGGSLPDDDILTRLTSTHPSALERAEDIQAKLRQKGLG